MSVITVSQLNKYAAGLLESDPLLSDVSVSGEISSYKKYPSGHLYFNLKDSDCSVSCVMFRSNAMLLNFDLNDGAKVVIAGRASIYDRDGKFQLYVNNIKPVGVGDLYLAFESLKLKLESEGLFDISKKKKIPLLPKRIGVATSQSGAVIRDIINVLKRRFPGFNMILIPVKVQGDGAAESIINAIEIFNKEKNVDVIIIARGGGSMEDLWCFNNELLARKIHASDIPIISAVGHETDFTICDFVSDLRAPTPSAAAELVMPIRSELVDSIVEYKRIMNRNMVRLIEYSKLRMHKASDSIYLTQPDILFRQKSEHVDTYFDRLNAAMNILIEKCKVTTQMTIKHLDALSPLKLMSSGYGIIENTKTGRRVYSRKDVVAGDRVRINIKDGRINCEVVSIDEDGNYHI